jgi:hypothetical protein
MPCVGERHIVRADFVPSASCWGFSLTRLLGGRNAECGAAGVPSPIPLNALQPPLVMYC